MLVPFILFAAAHQAESFDFKRTYATGQTETYAVTIKMQPHDFSLTATLTVKELKALANGSEQCSLDVSKSEMLVSGAPITGEETPHALIELDKASWPVKIGQMEKNLPYTVFLIASLLPTGPIKTGDSVEVSWVGKEGVGKIMGKMTLLEIKEIGGKKIAVFKDKLEVTPGGDHSAAAFSDTREIDVATGRMLKSEAKVAIGENDGTFTIVAG